MTTLFRALTPTPPACHKPATIRSTAAILRVAKIEALESRQLLHGEGGDAALPIVPLPDGSADASAFAAHVDFAPPSADPVDGYVVDSGAVQADRGNGFAYGWLTRKSVTLTTRKHSPLAPDARFDSFASMKASSVWQLAVPNGTYTVKVAVGDSKTKKATYAIDVEGVAVVRVKTTKDERFAERTAVVTVTDGMLTLEAANKTKNRLSFVDVTPVVSTPTPTPTPVPPVDGFPIVTAWRDGAPSPIARAESVGLAVDGKLYVFGGIDGPGQLYHFPITGRSDAYDPATDTWTQLADMPEPFTHCDAAADGHTIWFAGIYVGDTPGPGSAHVWKYDIDANAWSRGPDLPAARGGGGAAIVGRELHYFGGRNGDRSKDESTHWALNLDDLATGWVDRAKMPLATNHTAAAEADGKIYAIGGQTGEADHAVAQAEVDCYDPATDTWTRVADLPAPRSHNNAATLTIESSTGQRILVVGGEGELGVYHPEVFGYDPATNVWSTVAVLPEDQGTAVAGIIGNELIVATGDGPGGGDKVHIATLA